ncbi:MAG: sugar ABC transporter permease [Bifidobacteriaceae bacterium]|nr:sugar ABC transporter permease [Bifidobacteriaceae bacterium]
MAKSKVSEGVDTRSGLKAAAWRRRLPLMPALIFLVVVTQIPFVVTIVISLFHWVVMYPNDTRFDWFANYVAVLRDPYLRAAILNTAVMVVVGVLAALVIGTFLALLLNRTFFGRGFVRTLLITPFLIMPMAASLMWKHLIYNAEYGLINGVLKWMGNTFGFDAPQPEWVSGSPKVAVILVLVWTWTPFMMLITLAGLQAQDPEVKEAAMIDGANAFQQFRFLTFKHLRQYLELSTVLGVIYLLNAYDQVFSITQGGPGTATTNLPYQIYVTIFRGYDYGRGAAAGVLVVIVSIIISNFGLKLISSLNDVIPAGGRKK